PAPAHPQPLSLHDALPIWPARALRPIVLRAAESVHRRRDGFVELEERARGAHPGDIDLRKEARLLHRLALQRPQEARPVNQGHRDRKSTRLNSVTVRTRMP